MGADYGGAKLALGNYGEALVFSKYVESGWTIFKRDVSILPETKKRVDHDFDGIIWIDGIYLNIEIKTYIPRKDYPSMNSILMKNYVVYEKVYQITKNLYLYFVDYVTGKIYSIDFADVIKFKNLDYPVKNYTEADIDFLSNVYPTWTEYRETHVIVPVNACNEIVNLTDEEIFKLKSLKNA